MELYVDVYNSMGVHLRNYFYMVSAGPNIVWGAFWIVSIFSINEIFVSQQFLWYGFLFAIGWISVLLSQAVIPHLSSHYSTRIYRILISMEIIGFILYPFSIIYKSIYGFLLISFFVGFLDEIAKGILPSVFKSISNDDNLKAGVSHLRSWNMASRAIGIAVSGLLYSLMGSITYFILAMILFVFLLNSLKLPREVRISSEGSNKYDVNKIFKKFMANPIYSFINVFSSYEIIDGIFYIAMVEYAVSTLAMSSITYSILQISMYATGILGALIYKISKIRDQKIVLYTSIMSFLTVFLVFYSNGVLDFIILMAVFIVLASVRGTLYYTTMYRYQEKGSINLVIAGYTLTTSICRIIGLAVGDLLMTLFQPKLLFLTVGIALIFNASLSIPKFLRTKHGKNNIRLEAEQ